MIIVNSYNKLLLFTSKRGRPWQRRWVRFGKQASLSMSSHEERSVLFRLRNLSDRNVWWDEIVGLADSHSDSLRENCRSGVASGLVTSRVLMGQSARISDWRLGNAAPSLHTSRQSLIVLSEIIEIHRIIENFQTNHVLKVNCVIMTHHSTYLFLNFNNSNIDILALLGITFPCR